MKKTIKNFELNAIQFLTGAGDTEVRCNVRFDTDVGMVNQSIGIALTVTPEITAAISDALSQSKVQLADGGWEVDEAVPDE